MAVFNSSALLTMLFTLLLNIIINVQSESFSFTFPRFDQSTRNIAFAGDATISGGAIQLTKMDNLSNPLQHSVGLAAFFSEVRLYDRNNSGRFHFSTDFTFVVRRQVSSVLHGDGMTFFLGSTDFEFPRRNSTGGFLGLFTPQTAFSPPGTNKIVAVEFDSYANEWDPHPVSQSPHIGINLGSIRSKDTVSWPSDEEPIGQIARAMISYDSESLELRASVSYPAGNTAATILTSEIDLTEVLPEKVVVGFSAATGDLVETHQVLSWDYSSTT
ncbi:mannose/glucose-specific lectin-like [Neltuma alba]|uniref:mannose/glucose-specific lectin-like n=1 Tax=Neltuma alba TaxID=207710 RepID=UPI0010A54958|nr:mannose/glucose-specific lectin-like [Prosopis alba]